MSGKKYKGVKTDALITIKVSGAYYADLKSSLFEYLHEGETQESVNVILKNIQDLKFTSPKEKYCHVMMVMLAQIEVDAQDQGLITEFTTPLGEDPQN